MQSATEIQLSQTFECRDNALSIVTETRVEKHTYAAGLSGERAYSDSLS